MKISALVFAFTLGTTAASHACDVCAIYAATEAMGISAQGPFASVAQQFTHFGTLQLDGREVADPAGQHLNSSITQIVAGYAFTPRFSLQVNVPYIYRTFRRAKGFDIDTGTENGLGDVSLVASLLALRKETTDFTFTWKLLGGVKFPTGETRRIKEEFGETEIEGAPESGIHGHDLALGSGSFDGVIGTRFYMRFNRLFFTGEVQYAIRGEGDFSYRFANDLTWDFGPGVYALLNDNYTAALRASFSGEHKDLDGFRGESAQDTGIASWYAGPEVVATWGSRVSAEAGVDIPLSIDNTALQIVPDYRVHAALTVRF